MLHSAVIKGDKNFYQQDKAQKLPHCMPTKNLCQNFVLISLFFVSTVAAAVITATAAVTVSYYTQSLGLKFGIVKQWPWSPQNSLESRSI